MRKIFIQYRVFGTTYTQSFKDLAGYILVRRGVARAELLTELTRYYYHHSSLLISKI